MTTPAPLMPVEEFGKRLGRLSGLEVHRLALDAAYRRSISENEALHQLVTDYAGEAARLDWLEAQQHAVNPLAALLIKNPLGGWDNTALPVRAEIDRARGAVRGDAAIPKHTAELLAVVAEFGIEDSKRVADASMVVDARRRTEGLWPIADRIRRLIVVRDAAIREDAPCEECGHAKEEHSDPPMPWCRKCGGASEAFHTYRPAPVQPPREDALNRASAEVAAIWPPKGADAAAPVQPPADREPPTFGEPKVYRDFEPCEIGRACLSHITHPCHNCGRIAGRYTLAPAPADEQEFEKAVSKLEEFDAGHWRHCDTQQEWATRHTECTCGYRAARTEVMRLYREMGESKRPTPLTKHDSGK